MRIAFAIFLGIICLKLIFDLYMERVTKEGQETYAIIAAFFTGLFFGEILFGFLQERKRRQQIKKYFGDLKL